MVNLNLLDCRCLSSFGVCLYVSSVNWSSLSLFLNSIIDDFYMHKYFRMMCIDATFDSLRTGNGSSTDGTEFFGKYFVNLWYQWKKNASFMRLRWTKLCWCDWANEAYVFLFFGFSIHSSVALLYYRIFFSLFARNHPIIYPEFRFFWCRWKSGLSFQYNPRGWATQHSILCQVFRCWYIARNFSCCIDNPICCTANSCNW